VNWGYELDHTVLPSTPANFGWRKAREKEVLGLSISERPTLVILPSGLSDADWGYVRAAVAANPGMSEFTVPYGIFQAPRRQKTVTYQGWQLPLRARIPSRHH